VVDPDLFYSHFKDLMRRQHRVVSFFCDLNIFVGEEVDKWVSYVGEFFVVFYDLVLNPDLF
jgi:hypothetical protein